AGTVSGTQALVGPIMQFRVGRDVSDSSRIPEEFRPRPRWVSHAPSIPDMTWVFAQGVDGAGRSAWTINGQTFDPERVDAEVELDSIETWELINTSNVSHLVHVHGVPFAVLGRNGSSPPLWEEGLEDTVMLDPRDHVTIAARFPDYAGTFLIHCHMLEHEDHGMMAQFEVIRSNVDAYAPTRAGGR
ncbi:MAG: multicopper oxidase family protein, partial [Actinomycetota bacterium]